MHSVEVNGVELERESRWPQLLIDMLIADCFVPLLIQPVLADRYQLIRYHKRGWVGGRAHPPPVNIADHAADAAALLDELGVRRAHIVGHSTGAAIGAQLALDHPEKVHTLTMLEPSCRCLSAKHPEGRRAGVRGVQNSDHWSTRCSCLPRVASIGTCCRALLEERYPGVVAQSIEDADTFFGIELPSLTTWTFGPEPAAAIHQPVLSGCRDPAAVVEIAEFLRSSLPHVEERTIDGVGHLLQIQRPEPVAGARRGFE